MADISFEITKEMAVLSTSKKGWSKEINLVSWNNRDAKYDIREWDPDHEKMGKGITLSEDEARLLFDALKKEFEK